MANRSTFPMVDRLIGGDLADRLKAWREDDLSYEDIAYRIRDACGIERSARTIQRWYEEEVAA